MSAANVANPFAGINSREFNSRARKNRNLMLLEFPHKNHLIARSNSVEPFDINSQNGKYIISAHGSIMGGYTFKVPEKINFITLSEPGFGIPPDLAMDKAIETIYKKGKSLFSNNDLGEKLTLEGENLLDEFRRKYPSDHLFFKNHLGKSIANDMFLSFNRNGKTEGSLRLIGIKELSSKNSNQLKNITNLYNRSRGYKIDQILLSSLLRMYADFIEEGKKKIFIVSA